jgi:hypothetical protein
MTEPTETALAVGTHNFIHHLLACYALDIAAT